MKNGIKNIMRLVPGGGLAAHEAAGGHTIARHVGQTDAQLAARLVSDPHIAAASTFVNIAGAELAIAEALDANAGNITAWIRGTSNQPLVLTHVLPNMTGGTILVRGAASPAPSSALRVVLKHDPSMPCQYRIQTAYPE
jgi:filamentous hemagglutinin